MRKLYAFLLNAFILSVLVNNESGAQNYIMTTSAGNPIVPGTALVPGSQADDATVLIAIPFTYQAYGVNYNNVRVSTNGNLQFTTNNTSFTNTCPMPTALGVAFLPQWEDIILNRNLATDGIFTSISGVAPNRIFNIEWRGQLFSTTGSVINFEARLFEGLQRVDYIYGTNTNNGVSATIGVQGASSPTTLVTQFSCNTASLSSGLRISFSIPTLTGIPCGGSSLIFTNNTATPIVDNGLTTSTITVTGAPTSLYKLNLITDIAHTFNSDLDITITSPSGTVVTLTTDNGGSFDNVFAGTIWDDAANPGGTVPYTSNNGLATDHVYTNLVTASPLVPEEPLSAFMGENPNGVWTLRISDDVALDAGTLTSWSILVGASNQPPLPTNTSFANNTPVPIPASGTPVVTSTILVAGAGTQLLDVNVFTNISHTFNADLDITITSPAGTVVTLTTDNGGINDNIFAGTLWDNDANPLGQVPYVSNQGLVTDHVYTNLVVVPTLTPEESLGAFLGEDPNGTWTITISDDANLDGGTLNSWRLDLQTFVCAPPCTGVPSPGAIAPVTTSVCVGAPVVLNLSGYTNASGLTFQWRESLTPGGTYTNIAGANSTTYAFTAVGTRYYVCTVTCTNPGGGSATTAEVVVNVSNITHPVLTATPSSMCSPGATVIAGTASGGIGNYTHTLAGPGTIGPPTAGGPNNSNVSFNVTNIPAGVHTYTLTSTDGLGCSRGSTVQVTVNQTPVITLTTTPPVTAGNNYIFTTSAGNAIVPGTTLVPGSQGDDVTAAVALPFTYTAYGTGYNSLRVSSNGNIQFTGAGNSAFTNTCPLPTATTLGFPNFMPHWDDLWTNGAGNGIFTSVSGVAPNRIFNIEWRAQYFPGTGTVNFVVRLFEGQERVDYIYGTVSNGGVSASIGVQGAVSPTTLFTQYSCNAAASVTSGLGISFTKPPPPVICNGQIIRIDATQIPTLPQTFNNNNNTHIPAGGTTQGIGSAYPNPLAVSGLPTTGVTVKSVTLNGFSHTLPDDVDLVLVSPSGQAVILMSDAGGAVPATGQTLTLDDAAASLLADAAFNPSGTYRPTNYGAGDNWPAPGPGAATAVTLSTFTGDPNGNWNLYAFDDASANTGIIPTWSITFNVPQPVVFSPLTSLFTNAAATIPYTGTPVYTVWARPSVTTTYTATSTINGCTGSNTVTIPITQLPAITTQPAALAAPVCPGFNVNYSVVATGDGLTYQWQLSTDGVNWNNISDGLQYSGTNTANLTIINVATSQNGHRFRVIVSGTCPPQVISNPVTLVVSTPPTITTQPANRTVCAPDAATFSVVVGGVPAPNIFQWQVSTTGPGGPWVNLTTGGSYTTTLTVSPTATSQSGSLYRVIVTNSCGQSVTSNNATLTVNAPTPVVVTALTNRICLSDTLVALNATPVGGSWSGIGVSGFNFVPSATSIGTYTLTYRYVNPLGCTSTGTVVARVEDCPERIRQLDEDAVILYPNPNNGRFNIRINSVLYNFLGMHVYNMVGQRVRTESFTGLVYGRVVPIDLGNLPSGTYMVKFFYDSGNRTNEKTFPVVIQR